MSLRSLSDQDILSRIRELTRRERSLTRVVLLHLNEIERRRLHLKLGYASMFEYCTSGLGYSSSAAARRIRTARCIARFPEVFALLKANEVNLSTVSQVSKVLTPENKTHLLGRIRGKSQREVDAIVVEFEPRASIPADRVQPIVVRLPATAEPGAQSPLALASREASAQKSVPSNSLPGDHCRSGSDTPSETVAVERVLVSFAAGAEFMATLDKVRSLAWHRLPANASLEHVFGFLMTYFVQREDPVTRRDRRLEKRASKGAEKEASGGRKRRIAAAVKDDVFARDRSRCTYVGASGKRCESTHALQVDHVTPFAHGGASTAANLRLLCAGHNRLEAERILGAVYSKASGDPFR